MTASPHPDPRHLASAGWTQQDVAWEALQERALEAWHAGCADQAAGLWNEALALAREAFAADDPRLATSLANRAAAFAPGPEPEALLREALAVWDRCGPWLEALPPERRARSSTYHLRLETRYPGAYDRRSREQYDVIAAQGRSALHRRLLGQEAPDYLQRWRADRPEGYTGMRKIMAAAWLIAPCPAGSRGT